jgi:hypothetical protein
LACRHFKKSIGIDIDPRLAMPSGGFRPLQNMTVICHPRLGEFGLVSQRGPNTPARNVVSEVGRHLIAGSPAHEQPVAGFGLDTRAIG